MLEICPTIAADKPSLEIHPLGIGGKEDPVRLVFDAPPGPALNASLIDLGNRFRLIVNEVDAVDHPPLPKLPVARAVWECQPDFKTACAAWILAGGAHHTGYSYSVTREMLEDFATIAGIELVVIEPKPRSRISSRTCATTRSTITSRTASAPEPDTRRCSRNSNAKPTRPMSPCRGTG